jgi:glycerol kinase
LGAPKNILAIDQGTTSTKSLVIDDEGQILGTSWPARFAIEPSHPHPGWVEYDPDRMLETVCESAQAAVRNARLSFAEIAGIGLANQGETVIAFDAGTGRPVYPAISWQDRRGEEFIRKWRAEGLEGEIVAATGLRLDAYFSAVKLAWILKNVPDAQALLAAGRLRYGTSDAWLIWQLTSGRQFVTDAATASRTMLMDLATCQWSSQLAEACGISQAGLPEIVPNAAPLGVTSQRILGAEIPITGACVDQPAALFGQFAFDTGQAKITYGTGCFVLANVGRDSTRRAAGLLTSVGWQIGGETTFVFDGGVYGAGSLIDWLCRLGLAADVNEVSALASDVGRGSRVMLIPALGGLAAPRWSSEARACWVGMDQSTDRRHLARSALEAIAFRVREIIDAMSEAGVSLEGISVDGGLAQCDLLMQIQADVLGIPLTRNSLTEFTALGVGYLAGLGCGLWDSPQQLPRPQTATRLFELSTTAGDEYRAKFEAWKRVCSAVVAMGEAGLFQGNLDLDIGPS